MKNLLLIRHAKSSWKNPDLDDHDRPLNKRGERDRITMTEFLADSGASIELIRSSSALRALRFAEAISESTGVELISDPDLYTFSTDRLVELIRELDDGLNTVAVVGHNPAITLTVNRLTGADLDNVPTAGIAVLSFNLAHWAEADDGKAELVYFQAPKMLARAAGS